MDNRAAKRSLDTVIKKARSPSLQTDTDCRDTLQG